jgi:hypothetical protein
MEGNLMRFSIVTAVLLLWAASAGATDLTKVDRTIRKEPVYQTKPKYCLLVFGPEAKYRVWLVLDGDRLYVDKNGNGDLTEEGECIHCSAFAPSRHPAHEADRSIRVGDLTIGGLTHTELEISQTQYRRKVDTSNGTGATTPEDWQAYLDSIWRELPDGRDYFISLHLDPRCYGVFGEVKTSAIRHFAWIDGRGGHLAFADRPQDAPIIHFGGPLTLRADLFEKLRRGKEPAKTTVYLGTPGLGQGAFVTMGYDLVPSNVYPVVGVQFPALAHGQPPVTRKYVLKERC